MPERSFTPNPARTPSGRPATAPGIRGDATFTGFTEHPASPGIPTCDVTLPDTVFIDVPIAFIKNNMEDRLGVAFEGESLTTFHGSHDLTDEMRMPSIEIACPAVLGARARQRMHHGA